MSDSGYTDAIGEAIYGSTYREAHESPDIWDHLVEEQDRVVNRVVAALVAHDAVIREAAWDEGFNAGYDQVLVEAAIKTTVIDYRVNPYRGQSFTGKESEPNG